MDALQGNSVSAVVRKTPSKSRTVAMIVIALIIALITAVAIYWSYEAPRLALLEAYPLKYEREILSAAKNAGIAPELVFAIVLNESSFRKDAVSNVGAIGLMQVMPTTGEWISGKLGEKDTFNADQLFQPAVNLKYGCWYLSYLHGLFGNDVRKVVAAYHAGQGSVANWLKDPANSKDGTSLDNIPGPATAKYVVKVLSAYDRYRTLYSLEKVALELGVDYDANADAVPAAA